MTGSLALLVVLVVLGRMSAAENDDSLIVSFSKQELTSVIDGLVRERMAEIEFGLKQENAVMKHDISILQNANEALKSGFELLEVENRMLKFKVDSIEHELEISKVSSSKTLPLHPENDTEKVFRRVAPTHPSAPQAAFTAGLTRTLSNVGSEQIIRYDTVHINIGNNYDPATGIFTCDIPGVYVFHITMMANVGKHGALNFIKNGQSFHNLFVGDNAYYSTGSAMPLVQLEQGDTVLIKSDTNHSPGDFIYSAFNYFSGFLLYPRM